MTEAKEKPPVAGCVILIVAAALVIGLVRGAVRAVGSWFEGKPTASAAIADARPTVAVTPAPAPPPTAATPAASEPTRPWYQGGTLHRAGALEWQGATPDNKLATCADLIVAMKQGGHLKDAMAVSIESVDDLRIPAAQLVVALDKATAADPNPAKNRKRFANQTVAELAATSASLMGWIK